MDKEGIDLSAEVKVGVVTPFFVDHDAVCNDVYHSAQWLRSAGYQVDVFAVSGSSGREVVRPISELQSFLRHQSDIVYYHFSTGRADVLQAVAQLTCRKLLKFHNITPASMFSVWSDELAEACRTGYAEIGQVAKIGWDMVLADSAFNLAEIKPHLPDTVLTEVLAPFHETDALMQLQGSARSERQGLPRILNVGRLVQSKGHPFLLRVIRYLLNELGTPVVLDIVGKPDHRLLAYRAMLQLMVREYQMDAYVHFHGGVDSNTLASLYSGASAYLCTSEHEGFCVPIIEAMAFGVPVVALDTSAVQGTVGDAGIVWPERDVRKFAVALQQLLKNADQRDMLGALGRRRFASDFSNTMLGEKFMSIIARLYSPNP